MIDGESQKLDNMNETVFPNNRAFLIYTEQDIKDAFSYVSNIPGIVNPRLRPKRDSKYLVFSIDDIDFIIRMSDHTRKYVSDKTLTPIYYGYNNIWSIDTLVGKYKPQDLPIIVNNLRNAIKKYYNKTELSVIKAFVKKNRSKFALRTKDDSAQILAAEFMTENQINEDRLGVSYFVLYEIILRMLMLGN